MDEGRKHKAFKVELGQMHMSVFAAAQLCLIMCRSITFGQLQLYTTQLKTVYLKSVSIHSFTTVTTVNHLK